ncbi:hypothetical protein Tco_0007784 [Tanacetum coccineum]
MGLLKTELERVRNEMEGCVSDCKFEKSSNGLRSVVRQVRSTRISNQPENDRMMLEPPISKVEKERKLLYLCTKKEFVKSENYQLGGGWRIQLGIAEDVQVVNTARPFSTARSNSQLNDKGFVDSGCLRHMSGNIAHLSDFKDFDGGYVTFGGGANGGEILAKGVQGVFESSTSSQKNQDYIKIVLSSPIWKDVHILMFFSPKSVADAQIQDQDGTHDDCSLQNNFSSTPHTRIYKDHLIDHVIGDVQSSVQTRRMTTSYSELGFLEHHRVLKLLGILHGLEAMQEESYSLNCNVIRVLVAYLKVIELFGTKWVTETQKDERGINRGKIRNIHGFYASYMGFTVLPLDVKSASCTGQIEEGDDIIFGSTKKEMCDEFEKLMKDKFQICSMGRTHFFLGIAGPTGERKHPDRYHALPVCACARFQVSPKTSHLLAVKRIFRYLKGKPSLGLWYSKDSPLELVAYTDSDYAGATLDSDVLLEVVVWEIEHHVPTPHDSPLHVVHSHGSDEGSLKLNELMNLVTKLSDRIGVLEAIIWMKDKKTYSSAYTKLILRVKKLESQIKIGKARRQARVVLSDDEVFKDDSSKQGRKLSDAEIKRGCEKASNEVSTAVPRKGSALKKKFQ